MWTVEDSLVFPVTPDPYALADAIQRESARVASLLSDVRPGSWDATVPGLEWTGGQCARHVGAVLTGFAAAIRDELGSLGDLGLSAADPDIPVGDYLALSTLATMERSPAEPAALARTIEDGGEELARLAREPLDLDRDCPTPWYGPGRTRTAGTLLAVAVTELLVHGWDVQGAFGRPRTIEPRAATAAAGTVMSQMVPFLAAPAASATPEPAAPATTYEIHIRGGDRFQLRAAGGTVTAQAVGESPDCVISMTGPWSLLVGFNRAPLWRAVATGKILTYGRKPWVARTFGSIAKAP